MRPVPSKYLEGLLFALTAFGPFAFGCVEPWSRATLQILVFLLALGAFLRGRTAPGALSSRFWLFPAAAVLLGAAQFLNQAAPDAPRSLWPSTAAPHETEAAILLWTTYAAFLWSVPRVLTGHEAARRYAAFLFLLGLALAAFGLVQAAGGGGKLYGLRLVGPDVSVFGPYYNRDHAANLLLMTMCVGIGVFFSRVKRAPEVDGPMPDYLRAQAARAGGVLLIFGAIAYCRARGAFLAMPLAAAAMAFFGADFAARPAQRRVRAAAALAAAAVVVFFAFRHVSAGVDAGARVEKAVLGRLHIYADGARWLRDAPLFGTGLGSFEATYPSYQNRDLRARVEHAHGDWLELALEAGLAGAALGLGALLALFAAAARAWRRARSREMRALIGGGLAAAAAFSAHSLFEFPFQIPGNAVVFLGVVGFLLSAPAWADKARPAAPPVPPSGDSALTAAACFLVLALSAARPAAAAWRASRAGGPAERAGAYASALSSDDDPRFLSGLAGALQSLGAGGGSPDAALLRASLGYALAAAERRPFDAGVLWTAGNGLMRLGRLDDAHAFFERSNAVRFSPPSRRPRTR